MPGAARKNDTGSGHGCFPPSNVISASPDVEFDGIPAARAGDSLAAHGCSTCPPHGRSIASGSPTVFINGQPAARIGDPVDCGGSIIIGSGSVILDEQSPSAILGMGGGVYATSPCVRQCMKAASRKAQAFVGGS